jgi:hypothetical protein
MGSLKTIQNSNSHTTSQDQRSHCKSKIFYIKFLRIKILTDLAVPLFTYSLVPYSTIHKVGTDYQPQQISMTLFHIPFPNQKVTALLHPSREGAHLENVNEALEQALHLHWWRYSELVHPSKFDVTLAATQFCCRFSSNWAIKHSPLPMHFHPLP